MDNDKVAFMNFPALLHFAQKGGVFFSPSDQEQTGGLAVQPTDEREEFARVLLPKPVDQREGSIGPGGMDQPPSRFINHQIPGILPNNNGWVFIRLS